MILWVPRSYIWGRCWCNWMSDMTRCLSDRGGLRNNTCFWKDGVDFDVKISEQLHRKINFVMEICDFGWRRWYAASRSASSSVTSACNLSFISLLKALWKNGGAVARTFRCTGILREPQIREASVNGRAGAASHQIRSAADHFQKSL